MSPVFIALGSLLLMLVLIYSGMHVAITLGLLSFIGVWLIRGDAGVAANLMAQAVSDAIASHIFGVVPLFVLTGFLVARADVGKDAFEVANQAFRRIRGGLGVATVAANAVFAAITGISIASAAVFSRVAVPQMLRFGYQPKFAVGVVAGSSVLGMLIPPSLLMILYGFLSEQSVGDLFTAGILPGLLLAVAFSVAILLMATFKPHMVYRDGKAQPVDDEGLMSVSRMLVLMLPIVLLIVLVLGGIYAGFFTATEAGAVGALLALVIAIVRRKLSWRGFWEVTFPLMLPVSITAILIRIIFKLKLADIIINVTSGGPGGATDSVTSFIFREYRDRSNVGYGTMLAMVYLVLIVIFMTILMKGVDRWMRPQY
jgi:tripartite ATP-independent transporter DctM subunit